MQRSSRALPVIILVLASVLGACSAPKPESYISRSYKSIDEIPKVTKVQIKKGEKKLYLFHNDEIVRAYDVDLGFAPSGHKTQQGDGRTPEGLYHIDRRNPKSKFYRSIGISYPNAQDKAQANKRGVSPGGDIFIHGEAQFARRSGFNWTEGCIAMPDRKMDEIWALVNVGTPILITP